MLVACPACSTLNRVADERLVDKPVCGHCKQALFTGKPVELKASNAANHIEKSQLPVVVDFWAEWCGPCKSFAPVFDQAARQLEPAFRFAKINTEQQQTLASQYQIRSIPTLILFRQGQVVDRQSGALPARALYQWLDQYRY